ncbi:DUF445 domain-containing protein [Paenibacillus sp. JSM ZJ436]|uniref:DUF445 domain-containing protein n=1 Tax=Paenibacillus sp. JSM ZJ436 TaxID=3376190 RepID=UPI00379B44EA
MQSGLFILINMCVAAFVGGITNHFAIKMLFHPRNEVKIFGRRLPFTPGLIPKRKQDIAKSLGEVVSQYLVTSEGLQEMLQKPAFRQKAVDTLSAKLNSLAESEDSVKDVLLGIWSEEEWEALKGKALQSARSAVSRSAVSMWAAYGLEEKPLKELVPGWSEDKRRQWSEQAAEMMLKELGDTLLSAEGQRMLREMTHSMVDKAGGFLGTMAALFVDEDKLVQKLTPTLIGQLEGGRVHRTVADIIAAKLEQYGEMPLGALVQSLAGEPALELLLQKLEQVLPWEEWMARGEQVTIAEIVRPRLAALQEALPQWVDKGLGMASSAVPALVKSIRLPELVQEQVERFPVERLEQVILSVSGKEFRAITWLGVALGALIGLVQSSITILWLK